MFKELFGFGEMTPEKAEGMVIKIIERRLNEFGVNGPGIHRAFEDAQKLNQEKNLGLTNNHLLNLTRQGARLMASPAEMIMYGGADTTFEDIDREIVSIRNGLTSDEKRS